ncbi:hypothetical protein K1719_031374 [Acacia pycnantha]|nr:hypothetical protein K1719_031374 [Acacia pycnantha]
MENQLFATFSPICLLQGSKRVVGRKKVRTNSCKPELIKAYLDTSTDPSTFGRNKDSSLRWAQLTFSNFLSLSQWTRYRVDLHSEKQGNSALKPPDEFH